MASKFGLYCSVVGDGIVSGLVHAARGVTTASTSVAKGCKNAGKTCSTAFSKEWARQQANIIKKQAEEQAPTSPSEK